MELVERVRPKTFSEVIAQEKIIARIHALQKEPGGLAGRKFFISGKSGCGKTSIARLIALDVADPMNVVEIDADDLNMDAVRELERSACLCGLGEKRGRAYIVNEAHGLSGKVMTKLLTFFERMPRHIVFIFTTTKAGEERLFENSIDAGPLVHRCVDGGWTLNSQGLAQPFAEHCKRIAEAEGKDGQPVEKYIRLAKECGNDLRFMLQKVDSGVMLKKEE